MRYRITEENIGKCAQSRLRMGPGLTDPLITNDGALMALPAILCLCLKLYVHAAGVLRHAPWPDESAGLIWCVIGPKNSRLQDLHRDANIVFCKLLHVDSPMICDCIITSHFCSNLFGAETDTLL
jgi:hypothetical protein